MTGCSITCMIYGDLQAQDSSQAQLSETSYFKAGIMYTHDNVYMGRKDSFRTSYLTPEMAYYHKSGLFMKSSLSYVASPGASHIDLVSFEGGYDFTVKKFQGGISATKLFFRKKSGF